MNLQHLRKIGLNLACGGVCDVSKIDTVGVEPPSVKAPKKSKPGSTSDGIVKSKSLPAHEHPDTIRILMIHGAVQNSNIFQTRTSNLRTKALKVFGKSKVEFVWAESPLQVNPSLASDDSDVDGRAWYTPNEIFQGNIVRPVDSESYDGWEQPMEALRKLANERGPFAGLIAFSQGGIPASLLLAEMKDNLQFAIFVSCFGPQDANVCALMAHAKQEPIDVPTMHVLGKTDPFVANARSHELAQYFKDPFVVCHDGGHIMIPKELFGDVKEFLARVAK